MLLRSLPHRHVLAFRRDVLLIPAVPPFAIKQLSHRTRTRSTQVPIVAVVIVFAVPFGRPQPHEPRRAQIGEIIVGVDVRRRWLCVALVVLEARLARRTRSDQNVTDHCPCTGYFQLCQTCRAIEVLFAGDLFCQRLCLASDCRVLRLRLSCYRWYL